MSRLSVLPFLAFLAGQAAALYACAEPVLASTDVVTASSGDTLAVRSRVPVSASDQRHFRDVAWSLRLAGISAPVDAAGPCNPGQPFADEARDRLQQLVEAQRISVGQCLRSAPRYSTVFICQVRNDTGRLSEQMVHAGLAWSTAGDVVLDQLQSQARAAHRGLWQDPAAVSPEHWMKTHWPRSAPHSSVTCK